MAELDGVHQPYSILNTPWYVTDFVGRRRRCVAPGLATLAILLLMLPQKELITVDLPDANKQMLERGTTSLCSQKLLIAQDQTKMYVR